MLGGSGRVPTRISKSWMQACACQKIPAPARDPDALKSKEEKCGANHGHDRWASATRTRSPPSHIASLLRWLCLAPFLEARSKDRSSLPRQGYLLAQEKPTEQTPLNPSYHFPEQLLHHGGRGTFTSLHVLCVTNANAGCISSRTHPRSMPP